MLEKGLNGVPLYQDGKPPHLIRPAAKGTPSQTKSIRKIAPDTGMGAPKVHSPAQGEGVTHPWGLTMASVMPMHPPEGVTTGPPHMPISRSFCVLPKV